LRVGSGAFGGDVARVVQRIAGEKDNRGIETELGSLDSVTELLSVSLRWVRI
jgi:hypothetical protein